MKVRELSGAHLDFWVEKAEGSRCAELFFENGAWHATDCGVRVFYSRAWRQGGPIIEREKLNIWPHDAGWAASYTIDLVKNRSAGFAGPTPLVAAMRAYVASKFGDEVPDEVATCNT
jgi:hypothetical protein